MKKDHSFFRIILITSALYFLWAILAFLSNQTLIMCLWGWFVYIVINGFFLMRKIWRNINPKSRIRKRKQLLILEWAINNFKYDEFKYGGLCHILSYAIYIFSKSWGNAEIEYEKIYKYIPYFTHENCMLLSKKYGFEQLNNCTNNYWWERDDKGTEARIACLKAIIKEIELTM
jgi:hypothetical protein